jgi:hypothetical protein
MWRIAPPIAAPRHLDPVRLDQAVPARPPGAHARLFCVVRYVQYGVAPHWR